MKPNALFPILLIQNNKKKKKSGTDIFYQIITHEGNNRLKIDQHIKMFILKSSIGD
jgi:hypothetical protein